MGKKKIVNFFRRNLPSYEGFTHAKFHHRMSKGSGDIRADPQTDRQ